MVCNMRPHLEHEHVWPIHAFIHLFSAIFVFLDAFFNITYASIVFFELPKEWMLTHRLKRYLTNDDNGWRFKSALFFCKYLIEPWDWNHCGLYNKK